MKPNWWKGPFFFFNTPSKKKKRGVLSLSIVEVHFKRALSCLSLRFFFFRLRAAGFKRARECELFYQSWVSRASVRVLKRHLYCHVRLSISPFFFLFVFLLFLKSFFFLSFLPARFFFFIISGLRSCGEERARLRYIGRNRKRKKEHHFSFFCCTK